MNKKHIKKIHEKGKEDDYNLIKYINNELKILQEVGNNHPFILSADFAFQTKNSLYIGFDFCKGGDFSDFIYKNPAYYKLTEEHIKIYLGCMCLALNYL